MRFKARAIAKSPTFQKVVSIMIILCSVVMGIDTMYYGQEILLLRLIDDFFIIFFAFEIAVRILAEEKISHFFKLIEIRKKIRKEEWTSAGHASAGSGLSVDWDQIDQEKQSKSVGKDTFRQSEYASIHVTEQGFWNVFDFGIVTVGLISMFSYVFVHPEFLIISRLFRVMRVLRLLDMSESLKAVERKIISIIPTIFSFGLLLAILLYIYSIIGIYLFGPTDFGKVDFSSILSAFMSLFQVMTLDGWSELMDSVATQSAIPWLAKAYFISFVLLTAIVSFNVFVAVLTSQVYDQINVGKDEESKQPDHHANMSGIMEELVKIRRELEQLKSQQGKP